MQALLSDLKHWLGAAFLAVVLYFIVSSLLDQAHSKGLIGQVATAPTPSSEAAKALQVVSEALKDQALATALSGKDAALSASQMTVANALSEASGMNARMAGALAAGLTKASPKVQTIEVATTAHSVLQVPSPTPSDDQIQADMKKVLDSTVLKTQVSSAVTVDWKSRPFSPISAIYLSNGSTGAAYTLHSAPLLNLDALLTIPTGTSKGIQLGLGLEHIVKGTSAGIGVEAGYNVSTHQKQAGLFVSIHS